MSERTGTCEYVLDPYDPSTWGGETGDWCYLDAALDDSGRWHCPHDAAGGEDLCLFHLPPAETDDEAVIDAVLDALVRATKAEDPDRRRACQQFVGARFGSVTVRNRTLDGAEDVPIDLRHARIEGVLDGEGATFPSTIRLDGATVAGGVSLRGAEIEQGLSCRGITVENGTDLGGATVGDRLDIQRATLGDGLSLRDVAVDGPASLAGATVRGETNLHDARFDGPVDLTGADLAGRITGREATVAGPLDCRGTTISGEIDFRDATLEGGADFREVDIASALFRGATLPGADCRAADLTDADLREADLRNATLEVATVNRAHLSGADLRGAALFGAVLGNADIDEATTFGDRCPYDPAYEGEAELEDTVGADGVSAGGGVSGPETDAERTTGAGADSIAEDGNEDRDGAGGESGTDVNAEPGEESNAESSRRTEPGPGGDSLEKAAGAYRLVEQVARANVLPGLVAHSFVRRQDVHRRRHHEDGAYARWIGAWLSRLIVLYGESWTRLVAFGGTVVVGFATLYPVGGWIEPIDGASLTYGRIAADPLAFGNALYFSVVTFASIGYGDLHPVGAGRILAAVEAVLGAVVVVLGVYVVARRASR